MISLKLKPHNKTGEAWNITMFHISSRSNNFTNFSKILFDIACAFRRVKENARCIPELCLHFSHFITFYLYNKNVYFYCILCNKTIELYCIFYIYTVIYMLKIYLFCIFYYKVCLTDSKVSFKELYLTSWESIAGKNYYQ